MAGSRPIPRCCPEVLNEHGYNTYCVGKWHLTPLEESSMASTKRHWPTSRGFERFYGFMGGETDQWYPDLVYDNHPVTPPGTPEDGYHLSKDIADKTIEFIRDAKVIAPDKPWFSYVCPGAGHAPHHVFKEWADKYAGRFDMGYERYREIVLEKQKSMGIVPPDTELSPINPYLDVKGPKASRGRCRTRCGPGTPSTTKRRSCSAGWPRCSPAS